MDALYYISIILLILTLLGIPILIILLLIKPSLLNKRLKKPLSRPKIFGIGVASILILFFGFGSIMTATEPESIKQARIFEQQQAEERARKEKETETRKAATKPQTRSETKNESVAFSTVEKQDNSISKGEKRTGTEGKNGERTIVEEVTLDNGKEISRKEVKNEITKQPVTKIILIGTYVAPPTPPASSAPVAQPSQTSAYYKNCSAVRAAGAAPIYSGQQGYARHLDRDGDGVGCE